MGYQDHTRSGRLYASGSIKGDQAVKELTTFEFQGHRLRVIDHNGNPWFIGNELCKALAIANPRDAIARLKPHQRDYVGITDAIGRLRETSIVSEGGMYKLALRSHKEEAEEFADLVCDVILPTIRKTGSYSLNDDLLADLKRWQLSTKVVDAIVKAVHSKSVIDDQERAGYAAVLMRHLRKQFYHETRSFEAVVEHFYGKGSIPDLKGDVAKMTAEIKNGQVIVQLQFPFDNTEKGA